MEDHHDDVGMPGSRLKIGFHDNRGASEQIFVIPFREGGPTLRNNMHALGLAFYLIPSAGAIILCGMYASFGALKFIFVH
jgi:hypothetical protein